MNLPDDFPFPDGPPTECPLNDATNRGPGEGPGEAFSNGPMWEWFGLSYSSYLVLPRVLLCGMPREWQERMVALLEEADEVYDTSKIDDNYAVNLRSDNGRFASDAFAKYRHFPVRSLPFRKPTK